MSAPRLIGSVLGLCVSVAGVAAQGSTVVVPATYADSEAPGAALWAFSPFEARRQLLIGEVHLSDAVSETINALELRRSTGNNAPLSAGVVHLEITLSHSPRNADDASTQFAVNRGADATVVFSGVVALPPAPPSALVPAPWVPPQVVRIQFQNGFRYDGGVLCVETVTTRVAVNGGLEDPWWPIDALVEQGGGDVSRFGASCLVDAQAGVDERSLMLGSTAVFHLGGTLPAGSSGFCALGSNASQFGPFPLPYELSSFGAPGCWFNTQWSVAIPATAEALPGSNQTLARIGVTIPNEPLLVGMDVFAQWVWIQPGNGLGLTLSEGVRATVGPPSQTAEIGWLESVDLASPQGEILRGRVPVLRLHM